MNPTLPIAELPTAIEKRSAYLGRRWVGILISSCWIANLVLLVGTLIWISLDIQIESHYRGALFEWERGVLLEFGNGTDGIQYKLVASIFGVVAVTFLGMTLGIVIGRGWHRSTRSWFLLMVFGTSWLALHQQLPTLFWWAKIRLARQIMPDLEPVANDLDRDWPRDESYVAGLGRVFANENYMPSHLVVRLGTLPSQITGHSIHIFGVDREMHRAIRFRIANDEFVERHFSGSFPSSFIGNIDRQSSYQLKWSSPIGPNWYLVRYTETEP